MGEPVAKKHRCDYIGSSDLNLRIYQNKGKIFVVTPEYGITIIVELYDLRFG